jgi:AraC-like DNA-binding protein
LRPIAYQTDLLHLPTVAAQGYRDLPGRNEIERRILPFHALFIVRHGSIPLVEFVEGKAHRLCAGSGEAVVIPAGVEHMTESPLPQGTVFAWLEFKVFATLKPLLKEKAMEAVKNNFCSEEPPFIQQNLFLPRQVGLHESLAPIFEAHRHLMERCRLYGFKDAGVRIKCADLLYLLHQALSADCLQRCGKPITKTATAEERHTGLAKENIHHHFKKRISRRTVAKTLGLNPSYLGNCFKKKTGTSIVEYIQKTRIAHAKSLLVTQGSLPVGKVARLSGFHSTAYFCRVFRKLEKTSPGTFSSRFRSSQHPAQTRNFAGWKRGR